MKFTKRAMILFISILTLAVTSITACGFLGFGSTEKWKEEVRLSDGRVIVVYREIINEMGGGEWASNPSGLKPKADYIRFNNPDLAGKSIEWRTLKTIDTWPEIPLILDMEAGQPVMYTIVGVRTACEAYNKYVYRNGVWIEEKLPETFEPRTRNLFVRGSDDIPKLVSLEMKRKIDENGQSRRPVRQVGPKREICG
ncbi:MAG: hypothetical protein ABFD75_07355 [Smithella sp.]